MAKKFQFIGTCHSFYSPILAPILIQIAYAVHTHTQFKMTIGKQSYGNDCSMGIIVVHRAAIET